MRRFTLLILVVAICAGSAFLVLSRSSDPNRAPRSPNEEVAGELGPKESAIASGAKDKGQLLVSAPSPVPGFVPVAILGRSKLHRVRKVRVGVPVSILGEVPTSRHFLIAVIDDLSRDPSLDSIRTSYEWPKPILIESSEWPTDVEIALHPPSSNRRISILARTADGAAVSGAVFRIDYVCRESSAEIPVCYGTTAEDGVAHSPGLPAGHFRISVQDFPPAFRPERDQAVLVDTNPDRAVDVEFRFEDAGSLTGAVRVEPNQKCSVAIYEQTDSASSFIRAIHTDAEGGFKLGALPPGIYTAVSWPDGYCETAVEFRVVAGRSTHVVLTPPKGGVLVGGRFLDEEGKPLAKTGVNINAPLRIGERPSGRPFGTNEEGVLRATGVNPGERIAILWKHGFLRRFALAADAAEHDLGTLRIPKLTGGVSVHGKATADDGTVLRGTLICLGPADSIDGWSRFARTDGQGSYRIEHVQPGRYRIWHEPIGATNFVVRMPPEEVRVGSDDLEHNVRLPRP